jgi:hypothetical protein
VLERKKRDLIVCYGKCCWLDFEPIFEDATWERDRVPQYQIGDWKGQRVVLSHHFAHIYDLERLAEVCWGSRSQG